MFFLSNNKPFDQTGCHTEEAIKTSAITITRATKFIAMLQQLHFNTKIYTCALNIFFVKKDMLQSRFERNVLENGNLICKARAYPRKIKTNNMNFINAAISPL